MSRLIVRLALALAAFCLPLEAVAARAVDLTLPPFVSAYQPRTAAERGIWMQADEDERQLRDSRLLIDDAALNAYVRHVLCRTVGEERCHAVRLYVLRVPAVNATTGPSGAISVWSGLLLRLRDEAELGAVLGHEFAHFEQRHTLALEHRRLGATDLTAWAAMVAGGAAPLVRLIMTASTFSFSRAQESEADSLGLRFVAAAGYDPRRVAVVWARQMDEADARAAGHKQRSRRYDGVHLLSTHPTDLQRMTAMRAAAATLSSGGQSRRRPMPRHCGRGGRRFWPIRSSSTTLAAPTICSASWHRTVGARTCCSRAANSIASAATRATWSPRRTSTVRRSRSTSAMPRATAGSAWRCCGAARRRQAAPSCGAISSSRPRPATPRWCAHSFREGLHDEPPPRRMRAAARRRHHARVRGQ